ncbi:MAG TPA: S8 family serine peptidase [Candidatus Limnocylindria bacterium]
MRALTLIAILLVVLPPGSHAAAASPTTAARLLVRFKAEASADDRAAALRVLGAIVDTQIAPLGITRVVLPDDLAASDAARRIAGDPAVMFAEPDAIVRTELVPNDALWSTDPYTGLGQWGWRRASVDRAWDLTRGSNRMTVAVIDTGVDPSHPDLAGALLPGATFTSVLSSGCSRGDADDNSHGTHVAGVIGAVGNNSIGISGVAFGVRILPIKALDCAGTGATSDIAQAIVFAIDSGARIVNISLGTISANATLRAAVDYAADHNVLVVAAAGNCGTGGGRCASPNVTEYPAAFPGVVAVGATASDDGLATFSTQGPQVALSAPGVDIVSTTPSYSTFLSARGVSSGYASFSGTSQAAAFVTGVAALVWASEPGLTAKAVSQRLAATADDLGAPGRDDGYGAGRVNALRAVSRAGVSQGFGATYETRGVPHAVTAGTTFTAQIRVTNEAATTWRATGDEAVRLSYHWIDASGSAAVWDGIRTFLSADIAPGGVATIPAQVLAPVGAASYALRFDLVRDGVAWFSQRGVEPADVSVSVGRGFAASYAPEPGTSAAIGRAPATIAVALTNTGTRSWPATGSQPVRLAYHWLRPDGSVVVWDGPRAPSFANDLAAGQSLTTALLVAPPPTSGAFILRLDLVQESVAWFSEQGIAPADIGVIVD